MRMRKSPDMLRTPLGRDEPIAGENRLAVDFRGELVGGQIAFEYPMPGTVVEYSFLPLFGFQTGSQRRVDDDELASHSMRLGEKCRPFRDGQVPVEMAG